MPLSRQRKQELVAEYQELIREANAMVYTEYTGLSNRRLTELRNTIREAGGVYKVTKLTLLQIALENEGLPVPEDLTGAPLAIVFILGEIPSTAKALNEFAEQEEKVTVRGGIMGESILNAKDVEALEDLPTLDDLRVMILSMLTTPSRDLVSLINAPPQQLVGVIHAGTTSLLNVLQAYANKEEEAA